MQVAAALLLGLVVQVVAAPVQVHAVLMVVLQLSMVLVVEVVATTMQVMVVPVIKVL